MMSRARSLLAIVMMMILADAAPAGSSPFDYNFELEGFLRLSNPAELVTSCKAVKVGDRLLVLTNTAVQPVRAMNGNYLYGIDVSDPKNPRELFRLPVNMYYTKLLVKYPYAYVGVGFGGQPPVAHIEQPLRAVDLRQSKPSLIMIGSVFDMEPMAIKDNILVCYSGSGQLRFYDLSDPLHPQPLSTLKTGISITTATFIGRQLLTDWALIDLSNPAAPTYRTPGSSWKYAGVIGTMGVRGEGFFGFDDLSRGSTPVRYGQYIMKDVEQVALDGAMAYLTRHDGLYAVDVTDPGAPGFMRGVYTLPSPKGALAASGGRVYVYDSDNSSIIIVRYAGETPTYEKKPQDAKLAAPVVAPPITADQATSISVKVQNNGGTAWSGSLDYKLAVIEDAGGLVATPYPRINLPTGVAVAPGGTHTFLVPIRAPSAGHYVLRFQMMQEYVSKFGPVIEVGVDVASRNAARNWMLFR